MEKDYLPEKKEYARKIQINFDELRLQPQT